ncbi:hypothetical protein Hanom_Chr03g00189041 [Helianthus anomalus]
MAIKRESGIQYFDSLLSILSLTHYDVSALTRIGVINCTDDFGFCLFAKKIKMEKRICWKDEIYKPNFPQRIQIPFTLDPETNTSRYLLKYKPP